MMDWCPGQILLKRGNGHIELGLNYPFLSGDETLHLNNFEIDLYFFSPNTLKDQGRWQQRDRFFENVKNHLRLHTPTVELEFIYQFEKTLEYLGLGVQLAKREALLKDVIYEGKLFTNRIIQQLKQTKDLAFKEREALLESLYQYLHQFRQEIVHPLHGDSSAHSTVVKHIAWCDEYLSYYWQYFGLKAHLEKESYWRHILESERSYTRRHYKDYDVVHKRQDRLRFLQRASMLKKFISEILYVDVVRIKKDKFYKNMAAAVAAALAASFNFFAQYESRFNQGDHDYGIKFFIMLMIAVAVYVFKDRIKDISKEYFNQKMKGKLPDFKSEIWFDFYGNQKERKQVALQTETLRTLAKEDVSDEVYYVWKKARQKAKGSLLGHDKVLHYNKQIALYPINRVGKWALKDVVRFDLRDFYRHLDTPQKSMSFLDEDEGRVELDGPKTYNLDLVLKMSLQRQGIKTIKFQTYRLEMDQTGLSKVVPSLDLNAFRYTLEDFCLN